MGHYSSFIVRIWVDDHEMSKGYVQHVGTEETMHFASLDKVTEFIKSHLSISQNRLASPEDELEQNSLIRDSEVKGGYAEYV